jgi:hypothetical protein
MLAMRGLAESCSHASTTCIHLILAKTWHYLAFRRTSLEGNAILPHAGFGWKVIPTDNEFYE